jgi:transcriptional regulator with XRE-family HTH domain
MPPDPSLQQFGARLREERERLRLSQVELASTCGVGRTTQHIYESGVRAPDVRYLLLAASAGVDLIFLLSQGLSPDKDHFDWDIAESIARSAIDCAQQQGVPIAPQKLIPLLRVLYPYAVAHNGVDQDQVVAAVRLIA